MNTMFYSPTVRGSGRVVSRQRLAFMGIASIGCLIAASWRPSPTHAATYIWDADDNDANNAQDGSGTWSTSGLNWFLNNTTADIGWTNNTTDIAAFGVSGGAGGTITLGGSFSAGGIQFTASDAGSFNFAGTQALTLASSGILVGSGAGAETFGSGVSISLGDSQSWTNNSANPLAINGVVSGGSAALLTADGTGTLVLSGANTFSGGFSATSGTIKATASASALGAGALSLGGAALVLANDSGLNFGNATTISTSTTITSDRLTPGPGVAHSLGTLAINASTLSVSVGSNVISGTAGLSFGNVGFTGSPTFSVAGGATLQLGATNFNSKTYTKSGAGTLVLTASASNLTANTTNYQLLISGGTIQANANDVADQTSTTKQPILAINPTSGIAAFNAQTFNQSFFDLVVGGGYNFGTSTGTAGAAGTTSNITGTGTITLTSTSAQVVFNGGLSTATGPVGSTIGPNLAGATTFNIGHVTGNSADATFSGAINNTAATSALGWTKTGAGIMVDSGNSSTNTGTISVNQGTLSLQSANAIGSTAILAIAPGAATSAFLDLGTGNTSFARAWGTSAGQITVGNNTATAIDGFQTSSVTGASLNLNNGGTAPVWSQSGFQPGTLQLGTTSSLGPLKFLGGIQLLGANRPIQVDRGNFTMGSGNANLTLANNYFDAQIQGPLTSGTVAKSGTGVLSIAGTSTDTNANPYTVSNGVLLLSNGATGNAIGTDAVSVSTPAANTITAFGGNGSTGGAVTFGTSGTTNQSHLAPGNLILSNSNGAVSAISGSIGTLTTADLTLAAGNNLDFVLGKPGKGSGVNAGLGSLISVTSTTNSTTNNLTLPTGAGSLVLNLADNANANNQGSIGAGVYKLIAYNGTSGTLTNFTAGNGISTGTFKIGLTPLLVYSTYAITRTTASNGEIDLAIRAGGPLGVIATDTASNSAYSGGWAAGSNGGSGYGAWASNSSATNAGTFVSSAPEIDTSGSKSLGLFANSGSIADFSRAITGNLQIGHTLAFDIDNKSIQTGGSDGITLKAGGTIAFEFFFNGGNADYSVTDSTGQHQLTSPALAFTSTGLHVEFTLTSPTTYTLVATPALGGTVSNYTGTLANSVNAASNPISTFRVFNFNAGSGASNNLYINTTNILLPTWNGQSVGAAGGNFSGSGNWAAHAPVNGGSIGFDGTGSTVTDDSATSGITSLTNILFNGTNTAAGGPNATATTNAGTFTLQSTGLAAAGLSLGGGITNNSTNNQNINFAGASGTVGITLTAAQTFNGGSGGLSFGSTTGVNLNGFALSIAGTGNGSSAVTFGGAISGTVTSSALNKTQSGTLVLNGAATYAGATTIGVAPNASGGTIQLGVANGLPATTTLTFYDNGVSRSTLDLHGFNQTVAGLNDGGNGSGLITNNGAGTPTLTLNNTLASFYGGQITGSLALVKAGTGNVEIGGANTFTGGVAIGGGTLGASNTSGSATGSGAVNVNSGGTLAGGGVITGPVNINLGGTLAPGNSPGSISLGATTYNDGGTYQWEINNWTGTNRGTDFDFQNTTGTLSVASTPGTFPTNTFKINVTGLNGNAPGNIANFDPSHSRSWTIAEASAGITGFAANKFTIDTSHVVDNLAGGSFSLSTVNGTGSIQDLVLTFTPGGTQPAVIGQITAIPASGSIITGGSLPFSITVQNSASDGSQDLNFSAAAGANVGGSIVGPVNVPAGNTSAPQAGLNFTGTAIGPNKEGQFIVSDANAANSPQTGLVSVNVFDHATPSNDTGAFGSFTGGTLDIGNIHLGYSSPVTSAGSLAVFNGSLGDYRVALAGSGAQTGGSTAGLTLNSIGGGGAITPGGSAAISATLAPGLSAGAVNQSFTYTFRDDSALGGASANVGTTTITVTGTIYSGQSIWRGRQVFTGAQPMASTNGTWGDFTNWSGGSPGLDPNFTTTDSATFGAQSGSVTVDLAGVNPHVNSLVFNQTGDYTIVDTAGTGSITLAGVAPSIAGAGTHTIAVPLSLGAGTHITVTAGILRLNVAKSGGSVGAGVAASISQGATLELVGGVSALADESNPSHRAAVANDGTLTIGNPTIAPSTDQQVGGIDGGGTTVVTNAANLTANHINQLSLVIGNDSTVTIAASDASGNPLSSIGEASVEDAMFTSSSLAANSPAASLADFAGLSASGSSGPPLDADGSRGPTLSGSGASQSAVPEPSAWLLALSAGAGFAIAALRCRKARAAS